MSPTQVQTTGDRFDETGHHTEDFRLSTGKGDNNDKDNTANIEEVLDAQDEHESFSSTCPTSTHNSSSSKKLASLFSSPALSCSSNKPRSVLLNSSETSSNYFSQTNSSTSNGVIKRSHGALGNARVSGLLKKSVTTQMSLMQMWGKK